MLYYKYVNMRKYIKNKISIIIPTYNEESNIAQLIEELKNEIKNKEFEIIIVDDGSTDNTVENILKVFKNDNNVRVIQREFDRGLLQSIKFALQSITGEFFIVMDGDGQHSPKDINRLINNLSTNDLVIGCRNLDKLKTLSSERVVVSRFFNMLIRVVLSNKISDPLTGFFAGKISLLNKKFFILANSGFKVLLDLIFTNRNKNIKINETEINFKSRVDGKSKLSSQVVFSFFTQLISYVFNGLISSKLIGFIIIGGLGSIIHFSILLSLFNFFEASFILSHSLATVCAATFNFFLNNFLNFFNNRIKKFKDLLISLIKYYLLNFPGFITNIGGAAVAYNILTDSLIISSLIGVLLDTIFKYMVSRTWIWKLN